MKYQFPFKGPSTLTTLFNHMWPRIVAGIFIPVGNHYFQALASTLQFVAQVCDRLWLVPATDRAFAYITYMSPPHVALVCSGPPQCAATLFSHRWPRFCGGPEHTRATCGGDSKVSYPPAKFSYSAKFPTLLSGCHMPHEQSLVCSLPNTATKTLCL